MSQFIQLMLDVRIPTNQSLLNISNSIYFIFIHLNV